MRARETSKREAAWRWLFWRRETAGQRERVLLARAVFWMSGKLARIKTRQRLYRVVWDTEPGHSEPSFHTVLEKGKTRLMCRPAVKLMGVAMHLAWDHWDHFALDHSQHLTDCVRCLDWRCRGWVHRGDDGE